VTIDVHALLDFASREMGDTVLSQVQTVVMAAALLTMALGLWWWPRPARRCRVRE